MKIGIIGTGNIAQYLLKSINENEKVDGKVVSLFGRNQEVGPLLQSRYGAEFFTDIDGFMQSPIDLVVEAATIEVAVEHMEKVLANNKDLILSSIGAFKDIGFLEQMKAAARKHRQHIYLPSGAIGGLDLLQAADSLDGLEEVSITTRKSYESLGLEAKEEEECIFDGVALEAIEKFPKNVNVALLLSIAGLGADRTAVRVIADPKVHRNTHSIEAIGDFGKMNMTIENESMPDNPKTSYLAALSILATLQNRGNSITIGS